MPDKSEVLFSFKSAGLSGDPLNVVAFEGEETVSRPFAFQIRLISGDAAIDPDKVVNQAAVLEMEFNGDVSHFHGIVARFEQGAQGPEFVNYHALLVPRIHLLGLAPRSRVFLEKSVPTIVKEVLEGAGFKSPDDFEIVATGSPHGAREYTLQYLETDLAFIMRLMEDEGLYYFFEHDGGRDKLLIIDSKARQKPIPGDATIPFRAARGSNPGGETVHRLLLRQEILPGSVYLKDYNYRKPSVVPEGKAKAARTGTGQVEEYGHHFKTPEEGKTVAAWRAEEIACRERTWRGQSGCRHFRTGHRFTLEDHFNPLSNIEFQLLKVVHSGEQFGAGGGAYGGKAKRPAYLNRFVAIPADVQFRPARRTRRPRILGALHATVDAGADGHYAEVDELGRYKVILPFDLSGRKGGKASRFIRMAQPYAGHGDAAQEYGMHFPLHKGTEVLLTHIDGDPDRPIIAASVPNPATKSPVTDANPTQSVIRTAAQNEVVFEDQDGSERITIHSPFDNSRVFIGSPDDQDVKTDGIRLTTDGHGVLHAKKGIYLNAWPTTYFESGDAAQIIGAAITMAGGLGVMASAAGAGSLAYLPVVMSVAAAIFNVMEPGIVMAAPAGISAMTPSTWTAIGMSGVGLMTPAAANIVGAASVSVMSGGGVNVYTVSGGIRAVAGKGEIAINAQADDIHAWAQKNVRIEAETEDLRMTAEKNVLFKAKTERMDILAEKDISVQSFTESFLVQGKKKISLIADEEDVQISAAKANTRILAAESIMLECGDASIELKKDGKIFINGKEIRLETDGCTLDMKSDGWKMDGGEGHVAGGGKVTIEAGKGGDLVLKGAPMVKIN